MEERQKIPLLSRLASFERDGDANLEDCIYMAWSPKLYKTAHILCSRPLTKKRD